MTPPATRGEALRARASSPIDGAARSARSSTSLRRWRRPADVLAPADRRLLLDALAPPLGYELDEAIGTSYTLDLLALLRVPLAATALPWAEGDGAPLSNPFALL